MYNYAMFLGDHTWLDQHWENITRGVGFIVRNLDPKKGLQNQTQPNDWGRQGGGGFNSALNALNYHVLTSLASLSNSSSQSAHWIAIAERLKRGYNKILWDAEAGLYRDNATTSLHPQDGNALALLYNLPLLLSQAALISSSLTQNWNSIGPVTPELPDTISPFVSGLEVLAHYRACQPSLGLELMTRLWSYLLDAPQFTGSTLVEGITANGSLYSRSTAGYNSDAAYTSLSHGWSTAPVQALMFEILRLQITGMGGKTWSLSLQVSGFSEGVELEGGFETGLGRFSVRVIIESENKMQVDLCTPHGTSGRVVLPAGWRKVEVDGEPCPDGVVPGGNRKISFSN